MFADGTIIILAAVLAYVARFHILDDRFPHGGETITYATHAIPIMATLPLMMFAMFWVGLYKPRRDQGFFAEAQTIIKAVVIGVVLTYVFVNLLRKPLFADRDYSRMQFLLYLGIALAGMLCWRMAFRTGLRWIRSQGWNLRHVAIIGTGRLGQVVCRTLNRNSWTGIKPTLFISHNRQTSRERCAELPVLGGLDDLENILDAKPGLSGVIIALPGRLAAESAALLARLERYSVDVRIVPDMNPKFMPINMAVSELEGMPILSVRESPLAGWGRITKRVLDVVGALAALAIFALPMAIIAIGIRMGGPGPIIFRQERMSLNGHRFKIYKFRTMTHVDAEAQALRDANKGTEAWTRPGDDRITPFGSLLRRTSLDELPQLFNVILGEMSLVGPRPERPELIERFRDDWRGYMLRQNVKAGMTGWAQVNGLRGDTSLKKRLQYDLFYIRNWSIMFDLRILGLTVFRGFSNPNAY